MRKLVFKGIINGEEFNNVEDYNAKMKELLNNNVTNINASSKTTMEEVGDVNRNKNTELSNVKFVDSNPPSRLYPFMNDMTNDKYYLDAIIVNDVDKTRANVNEAIKILERAYNDICDWLENDSVSVNDKKNYLNDITTIINTLAHHKELTKTATTNVNDKLKTLDDEFAKIYNDYNKTRKILEEEKLILTESKPIIDTFMGFYRDVENETIVNIKEHINEQNSQEKCDYECDCCCCCGGCCGEEQITPEVSITESEPQREYTDISELFKKIFGPYN